MNKCQLILLILFLAASLDIAKADLAGWRRETRAYNEALAANKMDDAVLHAEQALKEAPANLLRRAEYDLAFTYEQAGRPADAERVMRGSMEWEAKVSGPTSVTLPSLIVELGRFFFRQKRYDESEARYFEALQMSERLGDRDNSNDINILDTLIAIAELYDVQQRFPDADKIYIRALDFAEKKFGAANTEVETRLDRLALGYKVTLMQSEADFFARRAAEVRNLRLKPAR